MDLNFGRQYLENLAQILFYDCAMDRLVSFRQYGDDLDKDETSAIDMGTWATEPTTDKIQFGLISGVFDQAHQTASITSHQSHLRPYHHQTILTFVCSRWLSF